MISDTRYVFESDAFPPVPGEDDETNPGIYGRALAAWLADALGLAISQLMSDLKRVLEESADVKSLREEPT